MQLGGHAPVIVAADADLDHAITTMVAAKRRKAGQVCTSPTRFLVERPVYADFVEGFAEAFSATVLGHGLASATQMGPLIASRRIEWMDKLVEDATRRGARLVTGGGRQGNEGFFYQPTVLADTGPEMLAMTEEPFGPLALMMPVDSVEAALGEANRVPVGLAAYGFTRSQATALALQSRLEFGVIGLNQAGVSLSEAPFGGIKETGYGSEGRIEGLEALLRTRFVKEMVI